MSLRKRVIKEMIEKYQVLIGSVLISLSIFFAAFCVNNSIQEVVDRISMVNRNVSDLAYRFSTEEWCDFLEGLSNSAK